MNIEKIHLGKKLFFDKNLSYASCHDIAQGGGDGKPTATGYHNLKYPNHLNTPTVLHTAFSKHFFWDGRVSSLREQAKGPTLAAFEMAAPYFHNGVVKTLREAISFMATYQIGVELTPQQLDSLEDFLKSLNGELVDFKLDSQL